jgi:hypothetical protein
MAFTFTKTGDTVTGSHRTTYGTYTSAGGSTGGNIYTGLQRVTGMLLQEKGSSVVATAASVNATFPTVDPITIVTIANGTGWWEAWGK